MISDLRFGLHTGKIFLAQGGRAAIGWSSRSRFSVSFHHFHLHQVPSGSSPRVCILYCPCPGPGLTSPRNLGPLFSINLWDRGLLHRHGVSPNLLHRCMWRTCNRTTRHMELSAGKATSISTQHHHQNHYSFWVPWHSQIVSISVMDRAINFLFRKSTLERLCAFLMSEGTSEGQKHLNSSLSQDIKMILRAFIFHIKCY